MSLKNYKPTQTFLWLTLNEVNGQAKSYAGYQFYTEKGKIEPEFDFDFFSSYTHLNMGPERENTAIIITGDQLTIISYTTYHKGLNSHLATLYLTEDIRVRLFAESVFISYKYVSGPLKDNQPAQPEVYLGRCYYDHQLCYSETKRLMEGTSVQLN